MAPATPSRAQLAAIYEDQIRQRCDGRTYRTQVVWRPYIYARGIRESQFRHSAQDDKPRVLSSWALYAYRGDNIPQMHFVYAYVWVAIIARIRVRTRRPDCVISDG